MKKLFFFALLIWFYAPIKAQIIINEYSAANLNTVLDNFQKHEDWIELYNNSDTTVNLAGYYLSDDLNTPKLWQFPKTTSLKAKNYYIVWCSGRDTSIFTGAAQRVLHSNFKLNQTKKNAETIVLSNPFGKKIDEIKINKTRADQSRGRLNASDTWVIFKEPTPKKANSGDYFTANAEKPAFNVKSGFYDNQQIIEISTKEPDAIIYYSLDGTDPSPKSLKYVAPITITKTSVLKAIAYAQNPEIQASLVEFATYFIKNKHSLKVVSITGGIELDSLTGGNKSYIPFGSFELFDESGTRKATTYGEFNSHGQDSWVNGQRSVDFVSRDECGYNNAIKDKIFPNYERDEFQRIILRAAGDDNYPDGSGVFGGGAHMRDAYLQNLVANGGMQLDVRRGEKAIVYMNGRYWGVYDLREKPNDHDFTEFNYGQGKYDLQFLQTWGQTWAEYGDDKALKDWENLATYVEKNNMREPAKFKYVTDQLDVKSLSDYIITNSLSVCSDWLNYNTGWWRGKNSAGIHKKWGFHLWDNDATFGYYVNYTGIPDTAANKAKPCDVELLSDSVTIKQEAYIAMDTIKFGGQTFYPGDTIAPAFEYRALNDLNKHMKIFSKLRENPEFNQFYITRYADLMQTVFSQKNMLAYFDEQYNKIKPEMPEHIKKWGGTMSGWENNVSKMRNYIIRRTDYLNQGMKDCYQLSGPFEATFNISGAPNATLQINSQTINTFPYTAKYYGNIDTKITALPTKDYTFEQWSADNTTTIDGEKNTTATLKLKEKTVITAAFAKAIIAVSDKPKALNSTSVKVFPTVFNSNLQLQYELAESANVAVSLIDLSGKTLVVANNFSTLHASGSYQMTLDLQNISLNSGMYFLDFKAGDFHKAIKVIKE